MARKERPKTAKADNQAARGPRGAYGSKARSATAATAATSDSLPPPLLPTHQRRCLGPGIEHTFEAAEGAHICLKCLRKIAELGRTYSPRMVPVPTPAGS